MIPHKPDVAPIRGTQRDFCPRQAQLAAYAGHSQHEDSKEGDSAGHTTRGATFEGHQITRTLTAYRSLAVVLKRVHESEAVVRAGGLLIEIGDPMQLEVAADLL